jgi:glycosyltransferase involved in cell wall biosynthesis
MSLAPVERPRIRAARRGARQALGVAYLIDRLGLGGTETQLLGLIARLDRRRVRPLLCLLDGESAESRALEPADCPILRLGVRSLRRPGNARKAWHFTRSLRAHATALLQLHFPDSTYFGAPLGRLAGVRAVVATSRDLGYWATPRDLRVSRTLHRLFIDATLANSSACAEVAVERLGADRARVHVIPNGLDVRPLAPASKQQGGPLVGMVANLRSVKSPETFVAAAAHVAQSRPDAQFVIAGEGPLRSALLEAAASLGIASQFRLLGAVHDVPALLSTLDVAVLCSDSEGLSNAVLEYMAAGLPIVCTSVGGNLELIDHGRSGLLVPPRDARALGAAILRLLANPLEAAELGASARRDASERFAWPMILEQHMALYERLAGRSVAAPVAAGSVAL